MSDGKKWAHVTGYSYHLNVITVNVQSSNFVRGWGTTWYCCCHSRSTISDQTSDVVTVNCSYRQMASANQRGQRIDRFQQYLPPPYSGTSVHERPCSRTIRFTNKFSEQKTSRMTNSVSNYEHESWQQRQAESIGAGVSVAG
jgi:hypothetical protein